MNDTDAAIQIQHVTHAYKQDIPAIHDISCNIQTGAFCCIIGQNGSGKTTLVKHLNGLLLPDSGSVTVLGTDTRQSTVARMARSVGFCFQNPDHQISRHTVQDEIAFGPQNLGLDQASIATRTDEIVNTLGLFPWKTMPPTMLSMGLRKLVSLAATIAMKPRILVLDEPTVGLDLESTERTLAVIQSLRQRGCTVVCVTHDMELVTDWATQVIVMHQGRIIANDTPGKVLANIDLLHQAHATPTQTIRLVNDLKSSEIPSTTLTVDQFCTEYTKKVRG